MVTGGYATGAGSPAGTGRGWLRRPGVAARLLLLVRKHQPAFGNFLEFIDPGASFVQPGIQVWNKGSAAAGPPAP